MDTYIKQAEDFLKETNTTFNVKFLKYDFYFDGDTEKRDIYEITLTRGSRDYKFNFGQSINCSMEWLPNSIYAGNAHRKAKLVRLFGSTKRVMLLNAKLPLFGWNINDFVKNENFSEPDAYSVLSCLTKYDPETFEYFCSEFGYDEDSKKAEKIYNSVAEEYKNVAMLWSDSEIETLHEIQ